jgi:hypothetical protein
MTEKTFQVGVGNTTIEQWDFSDPTPETGINGVIQNNWAITAGSNSRPPAGVLRYQTSGSGNTTAFPNGVIDTTAIDSLTLTVELTDMNLGEAVVFQFGENGTDNMEVEFNVFTSNNVFTLDVEGNGTTLDSPAILDQDDFTGTIPLVVAVTWDFANNAMSYTVSGAATASGTTGAGNADLSGITAVNWFRPRGDTMEATGTYLNLNTVTIETVTSGLGNTTIEQWTFEPATPETGTNGMTQNNWSSNTGNNASVAAAGILRYQTDGNGNTPGFANGAIDTSTIDSLTLSVDFTDINLADQVVLQFGQDGTDNMEVELNVSAGNVLSLDIEGNGNTLDSADILDQDDFPDAIPLEVAVTWDFANNAMSYTVSGSATASETTGAGNADLSGITAVNWFRPKGGSMQTDGSYFDLDTVSIETTTDGLGETFAQWIARHSWDSLPDQEPDADPNTNGLANLLDYAMGYDPVASGSMAEEPRISIEAYNNEDHIVFTYQRDKRATETDLLVRISYDLVDWNLLAPSSWELTKQEIEASTNERITLRHPLTPAIEKAFFQLKAETNP